MEVTTLTALVGVVGVASGALAGVVGAWVALRKDRREGRAQAITEAEKTINLLSSQTDLMRQQGEAREDEWRKLEAGWHRREERFEERIQGLERDYRSLVLTVTTMGLCANAPTCNNYNPGDRRRLSSRPVPVDEGAEPVEEGITG